MVVMKSRCCESIALVTFLTMASIALSASADCTTDLKSEAFQNFTQTMEILENISNLPQMCLDTGGDVFGYSGTSTCGDRVKTYSNEVSCLPTSCTTNETALSILVAGMDAPDNFEGICTGDFAFLALGDGNPSFLQCQLDTASAQLQLFRFYVAVFTAIETNRTNPDFSGLNLDGLCKESEEFDYFTYSATMACDDGDNIEEMKDFPACIPLSCSGSEDLTMSFVEGVAMQAAAGGAGGRQQQEKQDGDDDTCVLSDITFECLGNREEHDDVVSESGGDAVSAGASFRIVNDLHISAGIALIVSMLFSSVQWL